MGIGWNIGRRRQYLLLIRGIVFGIEMNELAKAKDDGRNRSLAIYDIEMNGLELSEREKILVDTYVKTGRLKECQKEMERIFCRRFKLEALEKYFSKDHVKIYLKKMMERSGLYKGWTKEMWIEELTKGIKNPTGNGYYLKLIGEHFGWLNPILVNMNNLQINLTQRDGNE